VSGSDADLAAALSAAPLESWVLSAPLVRFVPDADSDVARMVGLTPRTGAGVGARAVPMDALSLPDGLAVNAVTLGVPPDRLGVRHRRVDISVEVDGRAERFPATGIVLLTGQYLRGADINPRSHPGDGTAEVQAYGLIPAQRRAMRARLASGTHVPHPEIHLRRGRRITIRAARPLPLEVDGVAARPTDVLDVVLLPGVYRLWL
jgi:hypothetical protein